MPPQPTTTPQPAMDPGAVNLAKAIRQTESGGNFNAKGGSGESGAYQWMPDTWKAHAKQALGNENAEMTPQNQNAVAYTIIKQWKDQGLNAAQIAAKWNSGSEVGWENKRGVNSAGIQYDVPRYVKSVTDAYQQIKGGATPPMDPNNPSSISGTQMVEQPGSLATQLNKRGAQFANPGQGEDRYFGESILGRAGAVIGGIGDIAGAAIAPVFNKVVDTISDSKAVQNFAGSKPVSSTLDATNAGIAEIGKDYKQFEENNPKTGRFLRDVGNIASAIPIAKGAQISKNIAVEGTKGLARTALPNTAEGIMNGVARLDPTDARKFQQLAGESHGKYLSRTGNMSTPEQILEAESRKFVQSITDADNALASLEGRFRDPKITAALKELAAREDRIGVAGPDTSRISGYINKAETEGLNMTEINDVKRLYERNVKLDYQRQNIPESLEHAKRIDNDLREWQFKQAERLGLKNLPDLNKQTQLSKFIIDKLGKKVAGSTGNNAISLTDWIIMSGLDPSAIVGFLSKKAVFSNKARAGVAKFLSKKAEGPIKPKFGGKTGLPALIKGRDYTPQKNKPKPVALPRSIREQNLGLDEVRNANMLLTSGKPPVGKLAVQEIPNGQTVKPFPVEDRGNQYYPPADELPVIKAGSNRSPSRDTKSQQTEKQKSTKASSIIAQKGGLMSTSKIARIKDPKQLSRAIEKKYGIKNAEFIAEDVQSLRKEGGLTDKQIEEFIKEAVKKYE